MVDYVSSTNNFVRYMQNIAKTHDQLQMSMSRFVTKTMNFNTLRWLRFHTAHSKFLKKLPDSGPMYQRPCCVRFLYSNSYNFSLQLKLKFVTLDWPNDTNSRRGNSLGNHTVNKLYSFGMVFVNFNKEYLKFQDFRQNILYPTRSFAFFMYTLFLLRSESSWRNRGFTVENDVENETETLNPNI